MLQCRIFFKGKFFLTDVPASAAYFGGYEILQRLMVSDGGDRNQLSVSKTLFAGGMAGIFNWMVALPPDVLKSRLQTGMRSMNKRIYIHLPKYFETWLD